MLGKSSKKTRGLTSPSARFIAISVLISRKRWLLSGIAFNITHDVRPQQTTENTRIGLEQPVRADAARHHHDELAIGRQAAEADEQADEQRHRNRQGQRLRQQRDGQLQDRAAGTPFAIISSARSMMKGIIRMKVNTSSASRNGGMISRITYRSMMRGMPSPIIGHASRRPVPRTKNGVKLALLWHMHQPYYEDLATGEHILPWVRLHAIKDYWGMVAMLEEFPRVRVTFNLVPSLVRQVQAFAEDRAKDRHLELGLKPPPNSRRTKRDGWSPTDFTRRMAG
jgi:hypothetical protein